ncbi:M1 family metallopeptidase [Actinocorallia sp. API 0066]|uniref:M1 family metallopeptidase n=1 Tax=Actinocorallia sp. API 0066 TaxID=2896846 RepID=UPI001E340023|nr:M1 family metallopeptidase [Actinocorallia sp. API 0066]MCD0447868.1 M1 family metallopeptidase [Actinocorallia sp. API 0066]
MAAPRLLAAATLAVPLVLLPAAAEAAPTFRPGAAGSGEKYFPGMGNGGYDVAHYGLRIAYDPATLVLTGRARITATAKHGLSRFNLDLRGLEVRSVTVDGKAAKWRRAGEQELVITPRRGIPAGKRFVVVVGYDGKPQQINDDPLGASGWVATRDGAVALNQPFGAATWFPVNDSPRDKAAYDFALTVPKGLTAIANGDLVSRKVTGGKTTFRWKMKQPMASELSMVAIGRYKVLRTNVNGLPSYTAIDTELATAPNQLRAYDKKNRAVLRWLQGKFGPYPFTSTGGVVDEVNVGYSLETQGRPVHDWSLKGKNPPDGLIVHELAHQWFGDSVTPARWKDIWLNEGFATYAEWMWSEKTGGKTAAEMFQLAYSAGPNADVWKGVLADPGRDHIFDNFVYQRGAMAVHRLRVILGDKTFFPLLRSWLAHHRNGTISTKSFHAYAEKYSGKQLDTYFKRWIHTAGKPKL